MTRRIPGLTIRARLFRYWRAAWREPADGSGLRRTVAIFVISVTGPFATADSWDDVLPGVSFDGRPLREALNAVAGPELSVILDRRVDPGLPVQIDTGGSRRGVLSAVAAAVDVELEILDFDRPVVYVGPSREVTILALVSKKFREDWDRLPLTESDVVYCDWTDLTTPREILDRLLEASQIRYRESFVRPADARAYRAIDAGANKLPHDLWAAGSLTGMHRAEAIALVLTQYQLIPSVRGGIGWRILRVEDRRTLLPDSDFRDLIDTATTRRRLKRPEAVADAIPLADRRFRLKARDARVAAVMAKLEATGIEFRYDAEAFAAAGIDLDTRVDLDVRDADAGEFFGQLFGPLGLFVTYEGVTVDLKVKK